MRLRLRTFGLPLTSYLVTTLPPPHLHTRTADHHNTNPTALHRPREAGLCWAQTALLILSMHILFIAVVLDQSLV